MVQHAKEAPSCGVKKLEFGFNHGYTCGIQKMKEIIPLAIRDYKRIKKRFPEEKQLEQLFQVAIQNRELLREDPDAFIRYNTQGFFEAVSSNQKPSIERKEIHYG